MAAVQATLKQSNNTTVVVATLNPATIQAMVRAGLAVATDGTNTSASLKSPAIDTQIANATPANPISLGLDLIRAVPTYYPEKF